MLEEIYRYNKRPGVRAVYRGKHPDEAEAALNDRREESIGMATKTIIELEVKAGRRDELLKALEDMHENRRNAPGFLGFARYEVIDDPNKVVEITEWETAEARQAWLENSMALGVLNRLISLLATPFKAVTVRQIK